MNNCCRCRCRCRYCCFWRLAEFALYYILELFAWAMTQSGAAKHVEMSPPNGLANGSRVRGACRGVTQIKCPDSAQQRGDPWAKLQDWDTETLSNWEIEKLWNWLKLTLRKRPLDSPSPSASPTRRRCRRSRAMECGLPVRCLGHSQGGLTTVSIDAKSTVAQWEKMWHINVEKLYVITLFLSIIYQSIST